MRGLLLSLALLLTSTLAPAQAQRALPGLAEGVQYRYIDNGQPYRALPPGMVEVAEVFAYTCPHCAQFSPKLEAWAKQLPSHARLVLIPGVFSRDDPWSRVFFAAQTAKSLPVLHPRLFAAVHETGELPRNADAWFWGNPVFIKLGRFAGLGDEMGRIALESLRDCIYEQAEDIPIECLWVAW